MGPDSNPIKPIAVPGVPDILTRSLVRSVCLGPEGLDVIVENSVEGSTLGLKVHFGCTYGVRVLDEGDLNDFWDANWSDAGGGAIFEIKSGGWLDQEKARPGFIGAYSDWAREFFITGIDDCVNVIAAEPPIIEVIELTK